MAPMFSLAHGFSMKLARYVYIFYMSGLIISFSAFLKMMTYYSLLVQFFCLLDLHCLFIICSPFYKKVKKKLDRPFLFALLAIGIALLLHGAAVFLSFDAYPYGFAILLYGYIFGWVILSIIGYLYKIVPFLWWTHRYSKKLAKRMCQR